VSAYGVVGLGVWAEELPAEALLVLVTAPLAAIVALMIESWLAREEPGGLAGACALQHLIHALFALGLGVGAAGLL